MKRQNLLKIALSLIFLTPLALSVNAQNGTDKPLSFGVRIGTNSSGFTNNYEVFTEKKLGLQVGGFVEFQPIKMVGFSLEANYSQQGAYHISPSYIYAAPVLNSLTISRDFSDVTLHTINVPILFNFRPITEGNITPVISVGFAFDFILDATAVNWLYLYDNDAKIYQTLPERSKDDVTGSFKSFNYGPVVGLGLDFVEKQIKYTIGMRYSLGLNNIDNLPLNNVTSGAWYHFSSNTLSVLFGIGF
jgi:hypothetical protein